MQAVSRARLNLALEVVLKQTSPVVLGGIAVATLINYFALGAFASDIPFNLGRFALCLMGGWLITSRARGSLWLAAAVGPFVLLIDHVSLKGGYFVIAQWFSPQVVEGQGYLAALGVLVSFCMFAPLAAVTSYIGGIAGRRGRSNAQAHL